MFATNAVMTTHVFRMLSNLYATDLFDLASLAILSSVSTDVRRWTRWVMDSAIYQFKMNDGGSLLISHALLEDDTFDTKPSAFHALATLGITSNTSRIPHLSTLDTVICRIEAMFGEEKKQPETILAKLVRPLLSRTTMWSLPTSTFGSYNAVVFPCAYRLQCQQRMKMAVMKTFATDNDARIGACILRELFIIPDSPKKAIKPLEIQVDDVRRVVQHIGHVIETNADKLHAHQLTRMQKIILGMMEQFTRDPLWTFVWLSSLTPHNRE